MSAAKRSIIPRSNTSRKESDQDQSMADTSRTESDQDQSKAFESRNSINRLKVTDLNTENFPVLQKRFTRPSSPTEFKLHSNKKDDAMSRGRSLTEEVLSNNGFKISSSPDGLSSPKHNPKGKGVSRQSSRSKKVSKPAPASIGGTQEASSASQNMPINTGNLKKTRSQVTAQKTRSKISSSFAENDNTSDVSSIDSNNDDKNSASFCILIHGEDDINLLNLDCSLFVSMNYFHRILDVAIDRLCLISVGGILIKLFEIEDSLTRMSSLLEHRELYIPILVTLKTQDIIEHYDILYSKDLKENFPDVHKSLDKLMQVNIRKSILYNQRASVVIKMWTQMARKHELEKAEKAELGTTVSKSHTSPLKISSHLLRKTATKSGSLLES